MDPHAAITKKREARATHLPLGKASKCKFQIMIRTAIKKKHSIGVDFQKQLYRILKEHLTPRPSPK